MDLLPEGIAKAVAGLAGDCEIKASAESDLGPDGSLGSQWFVVTSNSLLVLSPDHTEPRVLHNLKLSDAGAVVAESCVGSGCLMADVRGEFIPLVRYSNAQQKEFGYAARVAQALIKGEDVPEATEDDHTRRCERCGYPQEPGSSICPNCVNRARAVRRLLKYVAPYRGFVVLSTLLMLGGQVLQLAPPYLTKVLIDGVLHRAEGVGGLLSPDLRGQLVRTLGIIVLALVGTRIGSTVLDILKVRITARIGSLITHDIRMELFGVLHRLQVSFFDKRQMGAVISRVSQDTGALQEFLSFDIQFILSNTVILFLVLGIMVQQNWKLAMLTLIPAPFAIIAATVIFTRVRWMFRRLWHRWSGLHSVMSDSLQGLRVVKAFAQEDHEVGRFQRRSRGLCTAAMEADQTWGTLLPILWFVLTAGQFIVWYAGGLGVIDHSVTTGTLVMFIGYLGMLYGPLQILTRIWDWMGRCLAASERVFEIIDAEKEESHPEERTRVPEIRGQVTFRGVSFGYDPNHPVLHDIDLQVSPGEMIGLVGHSGAGKSTLMNLLARFYNPQSGSIEIDGVDLREISLEDLRRQVGIVPQESYLFAGTIAENIAYARPEATLEEIIRAAKAANAHDFIVSFPDGYETRVGERGQSLSGGERQRVAIARAILHNPRILILDEATSSVDTGTEKQIQEALARLVRNRTTFAIAHRLSTLRHADRLVVLDKGKVAEVGTHEELMDRDGIYANLLNMQSEMSQVVAVGG